MDKHNPMEVMIGLMKSEAKKQPFCFEKCMNEYYN